MKRKLFIYSAVFMSSISASLPGWADETEAEKLIVEGTAQERLKQQPGVSIITAKDIQNHPPVNDLSDIIRKMPGVNLTGNSASGSRGNNRQIDIRGMGPENTLIMVDGVPVTSRNAVRYSWRGERDTRGDTNWVPVEMVERIEVIRGPAAARYGSGAAGGVVNIITKPATNKWHSSLSLFTNQPESKKEGSTERTNFSLSGPLAGDVLSMRLYGNINKTDADKWNINPETPSGRQPGGREGVRNRDINSKFIWKPTENQIINMDLGFSRQGNIYTGDTQNSNPSILTESLARKGAETNRIYRQNYGITHDGIWDWGQSKVGVYMENTHNTRLNEGMAGAGEGRIAGLDNFTTSRLENRRATGELNIPVTLLVDHVLTLGGEWSHDKLNDPASTSYSASDRDVGGVSGNPAGRSSKIHSEMSSLYIEDNIEPRAGTTIIPGLRFDHDNRYGGNYSPSLNLSQELSDSIKLKAGIARAFKSPNLYQSSKGYLMYSRGNGCPVDLGTGRGCYMMGNQDLDPETSVNKEIGLDFNNDEVHAGVTYFRNDYKNKIVSGDRIVGTTATGQNVLQWENGGKAIVEGFEASFGFPLIADTLDWSTNATYMIKSKQKSTGNPLSIIPKYTLNHSLDWTATEKLTASLGWTMYGKQKPRTRAEINADSGGMSGREVGSYSLLDTNFTYAINKHLRINLGVDNLLDKSLKRSGEGANTYNQSGRSYYGGVTTSF